MKRNLRGAYMTFAHDRKADWDWLAAWQPNVVRLMLQGSHSDPNSVSVSLIERVHSVVPHAQIILRVWDVDDRNFEAHEAMARDPIAEADKQLAWWDAVISRTNVPRHLLIAGANNEVHPSKFAALFVYMDRLLTGATVRNMRVGVGVFSAGTPHLPGDGEYDINKFAELDPLVVVGDHIWMLHEYMQPEGMYGVWTDLEGRERKDYSYLIGRHKRWPIKGNVVIAEWGIEGILYDRNRDPEYGNAGWLFFPELWTATRYADEYVACVRDAALNVIGICPYLSDYVDRRWRTADLLPAYAEFLARKDLCEIEAIEPSRPVKTNIPIIHGGQDSQPVTRTIDPNVAEAILAVESGNSGFENGRLKIRIEAHLLLDARFGNPAVFSPFFRCEPKNYIDGWFRSNIYDEWTHYHNQGQSGEWAAFEFARTLDEGAALRCMSMGASQVMGFNCQRIGYATPKAMFDSFSRSENAHIVAFFNYCLGDAELMRAIQHKDWETIAAHYNGTGNVAYYSEVLRKAYTSRLWA